MTQRRNYLPAADVLRVACIGLIAWYHFWQQSWQNPSFTLFSHYINLQQLVRNGYMMVDVLLVLSGFLLALPYVPSPQPRLCPTPREFFGRRFWRIVPSYWLAIAAVLLFWVLPQGLYDCPADAIKDIAAHLTFTHNLFPDLLFGTPLPGVLWTLAVEVQFYLFFPLITVFYREKPLLTCLVLVMAALCVRMWVYGMPSTAFWVNQLPCMLDLFACGMAAALIYTRTAQKNISPRQSRIFALDALVSFALILWLVYSQSSGDYDESRRGQLILRLPLGLLSAAFLVCGCLCPARMSRVMGNPATRFLSAISYNYYIFHQFLATTLKTLRIPAYTSAVPNQTAEQPWQWQYMLICFVGAGILATAVTYLWEKPIAKWGLRRLSDT